VLLLLRIAGRMSRPLARVVVEERVGRGQQH